MEETALEQRLNSILSLCGDQVIELYRKQLDSQGINASGRLGNSLSAFVQFEDNSYELCLRIEDYWKYIDEGRQPGSFPNIEAIKKWIQIKPILPRPYNGKLPTINQLAFLIGRKIEREGIKPKYILAQSLQELDRMQIIEQGISEAIKDEVDLAFIELK